MWYGHCIINKFIISNYKQIKKQIYTSVHNVQWGIERAKITLDNIQFHLFVRHFRSNFSQFFFSRIDLVSGDSTMCRSNQKSQISKVLLGTIVLFMKICHLNSLPRKSIAKLLIDTKRRVKHLRLSNRLNVHHRKWQKGLRLTKRKLLHWKACQLLSGGLSL